MLLSCLLVATAGFMCRVHHIRCTQCHSVFRFSKSLMNQFVLIRSTVHPLMRSFDFLKQFFMLLGRSSLSSPTSASYYASHFASIARFLFNIQQIHTLVVCQTRFDVEGIKNQKIIVLAMPCQIEFFVPELFPFFLPFVNNNLLNLIFCCRCLSRLHPYRKNHPFLPAQPKLLYSSERSKKSDHN